MPTYREKILNRLCSLGDVNGVTSTASDDGKTITVLNAKQKALSFKFRWSNDHFIGYPCDVRGRTRRRSAVLAIWKPIDAIKFATSYILLSDLRAKRERPDDM